MHPTGECGAAGWRALLHAALVARTIDPELVRTAYPLAAPRSNRALRWSTSAATASPSAAAVADAVQAGTFAVPAALPTATRFVERWRPRATRTRRVRQQPRRVRVRTRRGQRRADRGPLPDGEGLDWSSVRVDPNGPVRRHLPLPTGCPSTAWPHRGPSATDVPADRFWEMEDALVDLGSTTIDAIDTGRMMLIGFAMIYGNDWYLAPLEVPGGTMTTLTNVTVTDTFGRSRTLRDGNDSRWSLYRVDGADGLLLMPTIAAQGRPGS